MFEPGAPNSKFEVREPWVWTLSYIHVSKLRYVTV